MHVSSTHWPGSDTRRALNRAFSGTRETFVPDWTFKGSTLAGWQVLGAADWKAIDGELVGTPKSADGGWLVLDKSFQDIQFGADFKCTGGAPHRRVAACRRPRSG